MKVFTIRQQIVITRLRAKDDALANEAADMIEQMRDKISSLQDELYRQRSEEIDMWLKSCGD